MRTLMASRSHSLFSMDEERIKFPAGQSFPSDLINLALPRDSEDGDSESPEFSEVFDDLNIPNETLIWESKPKPKVVPQQLQMTNPRAKTRVISRSRSLNTLLTDESHFTSVQGQKNVHYPRKYGGNVLETVSEPEYVTTPSTFPRCQRHLERSETVYQEEPYQHLLHLSAEKVLVKLKSRQKTLSLEQNRRRVSLDSKPMIKLYHTKGLPHKLQPLLRGNTKPEDDVTSR